MSMQDVLYPIGIQNFENIRKEGYLYVDKTKLIYNMARTGHYYFLSRPRRFGKSLLLSTFEAYFEGRKELFKGLAVEGLEKDWKKHPVLHFDLNAKKFDTPDDLVRLIDRQLLVYEELYGSDASDETIDDRFYTLIRKAAEKAKESVVILVDEYDKPVLQAMGNKSLQEEYLSMLKAFYGVMKSQDANIRFAFLTGVTKFGKVSVFSDLNNLEDISMNPQYYDICGISESELNDYFGSSIKALAGTVGQTDSDVLVRLKTEYDGYRFCDNVPGIYNPFSLLCAFKSRKFGNYWFETGTPTYLVELLKKSGYNLEKMSMAETDAESLNSTFNEDNPIPVLYQSGYLTIKDYDSRFGVYSLGFPNREVEDGFMNYLLPYYANVSKVDSSFEIRRFVNDIESGNVEGFMERLKSFFADTSYELIGNLEVHYQNVLFIVFKLAGLYTEVEYRTSNGRIDLLMKTSGYIYIMEFKLDGAAEEALAQIEDKGYAMPFLSDGRTIIKLGVNFSRATRNIDKWLIG